MSLLPSRGPETSTRQEGDFEVVGVDEDVAPVLDALASDTARDVLNAIYEEPGTPSEIADRLDMSIQKVSYHLEKLEDVDLIAVAGTRYSEKGQEMKVYEPPEDPLVLFVGTEERKSRLRTLVKRMVPTIGALGLGSLLMQRLFGSGNLPLPFGDGESSNPQVTDGEYSVTNGEAGDGGQAGGNSGGGNGGGGNGADLHASEATETPLATDVATEQPSATGTPMATDATTEQPMATETAASTGTPAPTPVEDATEVLQETSTPGLSAETTNQAGDAMLQVTPESAGAGLEPGLAFFLGGVFALTLVGVWWAYRTRAR